MATQAREHVTHNEAMEKVKEVYKKRGQTYSFMVGRGKTNDTGRVIPQVKNKVKHRPKQTCAQATRLEYLALITRTMAMTPTIKNTIGGDENKTKKTNKTGQCTRLNFQIQSIYQQVKYLKEMKVRLVKISNRRRKKKPGMVWMVKKLTKNRKGDKLSVITVKNKICDPTKKRGRMKIPKQVEIVKRQREASKGEGRKSKIVKAIAGEDKQSNKRKWKVNKSGNGMNRQYKLMDHSKNQMYKEALML